MTKLAIYNPDSVESTMTAWMLSKFDNCACVANDVLYAPITQEVDELLLINLTDDELKLTPPPAKETNYLLRFGKMGKMSEGVANYVDEPLHMHMWKALKRRGLVKVHRSRFLTEIQKVVEAPPSEEREEILSAFFNYAHCLPLLDEIVESGIKGVETLRQHTIGFANLLFARKHRLSEQGALRMDVDEQHKGVMTMPLDTTLLFAMIREPDQPATAYLDLPNGHRLVFITAPDTDVIVEGHPSVTDEDGTLVVLERKIEDGI